MKTKKFSIEEAISFGFKKTVDNISFLMVVMLIMGLTYLTPNIIGSEMLKNNNSSGYIFMIFSYIMLLFLTVGLTKIGLIFCDGNKPKLSDLFPNFRLSFNYLVTTILYVLIVAAGTILLIIPGLIWGTRFGLAFYYVVNQEMDPITALKRSFTDTKGVTLSLFSLMFVILIIFGAINSLSILILFNLLELVTTNWLILAISNGIFYSLMLVVPLMYISLSFAYRKLSSKNDEEDLEPKPIEETKEVLETTNQVS